jgi:hypothetical protein
MGEVFRADDLKLGQPVALKFLPEAVDQDPEALLPLTPGMFQVLIALADGEKHGYAIIKGSGAAHRRRRKAQRRYAVHDHPPLRAGRSHC